MTTTLSAAGRLAALLRSDLSAMSVPGTAVQLEGGSDGWMKATWERSDELILEAFFELQGDEDFGEVRVKFDGSTLTYASFLSHPSMANLRALSRYMQSMSPVANFVAPAARLDLEGDDAAQGDAAEVIQASLAKESNGTSLLFLTGGAGEGKTSLLQHLTRERAAAYRDGAGGALWLYINAQGRRLSRLDDAVGRDLGRLQASFSFEAVSTLVRCGVLVLVVDGFDELLGVAGSYEESFSSLASFMDILRGQGSVIAAARSAYYEQEFVTRLDSAIGFRTEGWTLQRIRLLGWTKDQRDSYLQLRVGESEANKNALEKLLASPSISELAGTPFFVTRAFDLISNGFLLSSDEDLLSQLVEGYLEREVREKLREASGSPILNIDQLREVFTEVAEEMWRQDSSELSRTTLRELVGVLAEVHGLPGEAQLLLTERTPYSAVLTAGTSPGSVTFEHPVYYAHFLAEPLTRLLTEGDRFAVRRLMRRSTLPARAADVAGSRIASRDDPLALLNDVATVEDSYSRQVRENCGLVAAAVIRHSGVVAGEALINLSFADCDLRATHLEGVSLVGCELVGSDLSGARWVGRSERCVFERLRFDGDTRIDLSGPSVDDFRPIILEEMGRDRVIYDPVEITDVLRRASLPAADVGPSMWPVAASSLLVIETLAKIMTRTNLFTEQDDAPDVKRLVEMSEWAKVRDLMFKHDLLLPERRSASGRKAFLRAKAAPADLLAGRSMTAGVPTAVSSFWKELAGRSGE